MTNQNYLRGVQEADANGKVTFTTIFPACYSGRWPHIHFEVYPSLAAATSVATRSATSQIAMPKGDVRPGVCDSRIRTERHQPLAGHAGHGQRVQRRRVARAGDRRVGRVATGFTATLNVAV